MTFNESKSRTIPVRVGQVWEGCDKRSPGRRLLVVRVSIFTGKAQVKGVGSDGRERLIWIRLNRFRPGSTGYRLVEDVPPETGMKSCSILDARGRRDIELGEEDGD